MLDTATLIIEDDPAQHIKRDGCAILRLFSVPSTTIWLGYGLGQSEWMGECSLDERDSRVFGMVRQQKSPFSGKTAASA
jgi:hypothetical protein